jgi:hypothetical protein
MQRLKLRWQQLGVSPWTGFLWLIALWMAAFIALEAFSHAL